MSGPFDLNQSGPAAQHLPVPEGRVMVLLPDRMSGQRWAKADTIDARVAGYPAGDEPDCRPPCSRCGQPTVSGQLWVRLGPRRRTLCEACILANKPVQPGHVVTFRLVDSDLFPYVLDVNAEQAAEIALQGTVAMLLPYREIAVEVEGWPMPHVVPVDRLVERPAGFDDMRRAWPDKTDEELRAALAVIQEGGGTLTVVSTPDGDNIPEGAVDG